MTPLTLRHIVLGLLLFTGVFHLLAALFSPPELRLPLAAFGALYTGLSFYVRRDVQGRSTAPFLAAIAGTGLGLAVGGHAYLTKGGPVVLPIIFLIDILIIAASLMWLKKFAASR